MRATAAIADCGGFWQTLECASSAAKLIRAAGAKRILVSHQKDGWASSRRVLGPLLHPAGALDSLGIQRIREHISTTRTRFH